jgi:hypothetical protein
MSEVHNPLRATPKVHSYEPSLELDRTQVPADYMRLGGPDQL